MSFENYLKEISVNMYKTYQEFQKGYFIPSCAAILLNLKRHFLKEELINFDKILKNRKQHPLWYSTLLHEIIHCYQILGSSVGTIEFFAFQMQKEILAEFIKEIGASKSSADHFMNNRVFYQNCREIYDLRPWQEIRVLFRKNSYREYLPRVKDFINCFYEVRNYFAAVHEKETGVKVFDDLKLYKEQIEVANWFIDSVGPAITNGPEALRIASKNHCFNWNECLLFIPSYAIIEGYARLHESIHIGLRLKNNHSRESFADDIFKNYVNKKYEGIYGALFHLFCEHLTWLFNEKNIEDFNLTMLSIYELSLMTMLHPRLLFLKKNMSLGEILLPLRFQRLFCFFVENKISFLTFYSKGATLTDVLDKICEEMSWPKYSYCLKLIYELYDSSTYKDFYFSMLAKKIIKQKMDGDPLLNVFLNKPFMPVPVFFNDSILKPNLFETNEISPEEIFDIVLHDLIEDAFFQELVFGDNFKNTVELLRRMSIINNSKKSIITFLERNGYINFINPKDILT
jgi:hypothetical protein